MQPASEVRALSVARRSEWRAVVEERIVAIVDVRLKSLVTVITDAVADAARSGDLKTRSLNCVTNYARATSLLHDQIEQLAAANGYEHVRISSDQFYWKWK